jgi:glutathione peroxidase
MSEYEKNKCIIVVNVATQWGLTQKNYEQFVSLYKKYKDNGLEILAFPCN